MAKSKVSNTKASNHFDKYDYYIRAVQSPDNDVSFFRKVYRDIRKKDALTLREDFCGTFIVCQEWVRKSTSHRAIGVDLDGEPIEYGRLLAVKNLTASQASRIDIIQGNVLNPRLPKADLTVALNFSYFLFKERKMMVKYFRNVRRTLKKDGVFLLDCFGGMNCYQPNVEQTKYKDYTYYWDQDTWDPITSEAQFYIHFKPKGKRKVEKVFQYDWRLWTIPEIREILVEAGFKKSYVYWEGTTKNGEGDGHFKRVERGEDDCASWIAYIAAEA